MFRQVRFDCGACGEGFVDWHDDDWQRSPVFCVHCGASIVPGAVVELRSVVKSRASSQDEARAARALGVLKSDGAGFRNTLRGLPQEDVTPTQAPDPSRDRDTEPTLPRARVRGASEATSTAPKAKATIAATWAQHRRTLAPIGALLLGFAAGVPAALVAENPLLRLLNPIAYQRSQSSQQLARVSSAIDQGNWDNARELLDRAGSVPPRGDVRLATLRARLTLGLILANRPADAGRELSTVRQSASVHPSAADLQRIYDAWFPNKSSAATANVNAPPVAPVAAAPAKVVVTKRELLSFARDRQHRSLLDDAERLYGEVLRTHPNDAEARCGLAEVELLRGGMDDGANLFERALADNANYLPAWVGLADVDWLRGHPERAACRYQAVIDRFPASAYPPYIARRVEQVTHSGVNLPKARADVGAVHACDN